MVKKLYHLELKEEGVHKYYNSMTALFSDKTNPDIGVSIYTIRRQRIKDYFENDKCIIRASLTKSTSDL